MKKCLVTGHALNINLSAVSLYSCLIIGIICSASNCYSRTEKHIYTLVQIKHFEEALSSFKGDIGRYPTLEEGLAVLINRPADLTNWNGPYYNKPIIPKDSWGNDYVYIFPSKHGNKTFDLYSIGKNGVDDNGKKDDISNWNLIDKVYY